MKLSDLKLGDRVAIDYGPNNPVSKDLKSHKGQGTVIGLDTKGVYMNVLVGWKAGDPEILTLERHGTPQFNTIVYITPISDWVSWVWVSEEFVISVLSQVDGTPAPAKGATCACGYENPYVNPPYVCSGCKLWAHVIQ